jgi:hypothetical protein
MFCEQRKGKCIIFLWLELRFFWLIFFIFAEHGKVEKIIFRKMNS